MTETEENEKENHSEELSLDEQLMFETNDFLTDLECLKEMFGAVVPVLESQDQNRVERINEIVERAEEKGASDEFVIESFSDFRSLKINTRRLLKAQELFRFQSVVAIVSRYEQFMRQLLTVYFRENIEQLKRDKRKLSWKKILEETSYDSVVYKILKSRIEDIMINKSHPEQVKFIDKKLKLGTLENFSNWDDFIEITQRRNLIVHTGGTVNIQYLENCKQKGVDTGDLSEGDNIRVSEDYFEKTFFRFFELGLRLGQAAFRRMFDEQEKLEFADKELNDIGYRLLKAEDWELAEFVYDFAINIPKKYVQEESKYMYVINLCIARKNAEKDIDKILNSYSWEPLHPKFKIATLTLREKYEKAAELMKTSSIEEEIPKEAFKEWPLFNDFRKTTYFKDVYEEIFQEPYSIDYKEDIDGLN